MLSDQRQAALDVISTSCGQRPLPTQLAPVRQPGATPLPMPLLSPAVHISDCAQLIGTVLIRCNARAMVTRGLLPLRSSLLAARCQAVSARRLPWEASLLHTPDRCRSSRPSSSMALGCQLLRTLHSRQGEQECTAV